MMKSPCLERATIVVAVVLVLSGCTTFRVENLRPPREAQALRANPIIEEVVRVEKMRIGPKDEYGDAHTWQQGLAKSLQSDAGFEHVSSVGIDEVGVDLVVRGVVEGEFRNRGFLNFITWWPGPFLFMHNWRGSRFMFDASADVEVFDTHLNSVVGKYHATTSHELVHRSNNPGPMFAALFVVPGIVKGIISSWPRQKYRRQMYRVAYPDLWRQIAQDIARDQEVRHARRLDILRAKCAAGVDHSPEIGMSWNDFLSCQTRHFALLGTQHTDDGLAYVYENFGKDFRIQVIDGQITRWLSPPKSGHVPPN